MKKLRNLLIIALIVITGYNLSEARNIGYEKAIFVDGTTGVEETYTPIEGEDKESVFDEPTDEEILRMLQNLDTSKLQEPSGYVYPSNANGGWLMPVNYRPYIVPSRPHRPPKPPTNKSPNQKPNKHHGSAKPNATAKPNTSTRPAPPKRPTTNNMSTAPVKIESNNLKK